MSVPTHSRSSPASRGAPVDDAPARDAAALEARRALRLLEAVAEDSAITQRGLASKLGMALGLANLYLKRLVHKGLITCVNVRSNRLLYLLTPKGISEKTRLTYEFMEYSLWLYKEARRHLHVALAPRIRSGAKRFAIYGTGEAAELAYLSLKEQGLDPVAIFTAEGGGTFLGMPIRALAECSLVAFDRLIVATLDHPDPLVKQLVRAGIPAAKLLTLKPTSSPLPSRFDKDAEDAIVRV